MTNLDYIVSQLVQGEVIAYPTEAVFGLGCDPFNEEAIEKLLRLKQRSAEKGLILIAPSLAYFEQLIDFSKISQQQLRKLEQIYPCPISWIVPVQSGVSPLLSGKFNSIAIRLCQHQPVVRLCERADTAITSTSANLSGKSPCRHYQEVLAQFGEDFPVLKAEIGQAKKPSEIRDLFTNQIIRQG